MAGRSTDAHWSPRGVRKSQHVYGHGADAVPISARGFGDVSDRHRQHDATLGLQIGSDGQGGLAVGLHPGLGPDRATDTIARSGAPSWELM